MRRISIGAISILILALSLGRPPQPVRWTNVHPLALTTQAENVDGNHCPTGQGCGASASYCENYVPPSIKGAKPIRSLPYRITSPGRYFLPSDLSSTTIGVAVLADKVEINLNGHTLTYGTSPIGSGASSVGEYGIVMCNTGNLASEELDSGYGSNGYCRNGGLSAQNITIENGTIIQSRNASQFYDPTNCPGSGTSAGCAHHHETAASDVLNFQYTSGIKVRHVTLEWQAADSDGIHMAWQFKGPGDIIECNTLRDKVTQINVRAYERGIPISGQNAREADHSDTIQYNTLVGSPQSGIVVAAPGSAIQFNDINQGYYQFPPFTTEGRMYSNDYAIGSCVRGGTIAYNYIHSVSGRGIGCVFGGDMEGMAVHNNYVNTPERNANAEYGSNGERPGADWIGGCEINGGRGFESKESPNIELYQNTFILQVDQCGAGGIVFAQFPCQEANCPAATRSFDVHDNAIDVEYAGKSGSIPSRQAVACYIFSSVDGAAGGYFSKAFLRDDCTTDGDFIQSDGYGPGRNLQWAGATFMIGNNPLASAMGNSGGLLIHWSGQEGPPADERGFVIQDFSFGNGAGLHFAQDGTRMAREATVRWTYTPTVKRASDQSPIEGARVSAVDAGKQSTYCTTNESGQCSLTLRQETVTSNPGQTLSETNMNPNVVTIVAPGCEALFYDLTISGKTSDPRTMTCH